MTNDISANIYLYFAPSRASSRPTPDPPYQLLYLQSSAHSSQLTLPNLLHLAVAFTLSRTKTVNWN
jgi:hypothetical protein